MQTITTRNFQLGLAVASYYLEAQGKEIDGRLVSQEPISFCFNDPAERGIVCPGLDTNPFYNFFEGLWNLSGANDIRFLQQFDPTISNRSDDGVTLHGAYGERWRYYFAPDGCNKLGTYTPIDQVLSIINLLKLDPNSSACVLQMWDAECDLGLQSKNLPSSTQAYFSIVDGELDMLVCDRDTDLLRGLGRADVVRFTMLQEIIATGVGVKVGKYRHVCNRLHAKISELEPIDFSLDSFENEFASFPIVQGTVEHFLGELNTFLKEGPVLGMTEPFLRKVAGPMVETWRLFQTGENVSGVQLAKTINRIASEDWRVACYHWMEQRYNLPPQN